MAKPPSSIGRKSGWTSRWLTDELTALSRSGQWDAAIATFASLRQANLVESNVYHYTTIINGCGKAGKWEAAFATLSHMVAQDVKPNVYSYTALMNACAQAKVGKADLALRTFAHMRRSDVPPNVRTVTALIAACAKQGQWQKCLAILDSCDELLIAPNVMTFTAAIDGCRRMGQWESAVQLLAQRMRNAADVRPNHVTYNAVLASCVPSQQWVQALHVVAAMRSDGFLPVGFTQATLLAIVGEHRPDLHEAVESMVVEQPSWHEGRRIPRSSGDGSNNNNNN